MGEWNNSNYPRGWTFTGDSYLEGNKGRRKWRFSKLKIKNPFKKKETPIYFEELLMTNQPQEPFQKEIPFEFYSPEQDEIITNFTNPTDTFKYNLKEKFNKLKDDFSRNFQNELGVFSKAYQKSIQEAYHSLNKGLYNLSESYNQIITEKGDQMKKGLLYIALPTLAFLAINPFLGNKSPTEQIQTNIPEQTIQQQVPTQKPVEKQINYSEAQEQLQEKQIQTSATKSNSNILYQAKYEIQGDKIKLTSTNANETTFNLRNKDGKVIAYQKVKPGQEIYFQLPQGDFEITEHSRDANGKINQSYVLGLTKEAKATNITSANIIPSSLESKLISQATPSNPEKSLTKKLSQDNFPSVYSETSSYFKGYIRLVEFDLNEKNPEIDYNDALGKAEDIAVQYNSIEKASKRNSFMRNIPGLNQEEAYDALNIMREKGIEVKYSSKLVNSKLRNEMAEFYLISNSTKEAVDLINKSLKIDLNEKQFYKEMSKWKDDHSVKARLSREIIKKYNFKF